MLSNTSMGNGSQNGAGGNTTGTSNLGPIAGLLGQHVNEASDFNWMNQEVETKKDDKHDDDIDDPSFERNIILS